MNRFPRFIFPAGCAAFLLASCAVIPSEFTKQVDENVTFRDVKRAPERFQGKVLLLGGTVSERADLPGETKMLIHEHNVDSRYRPNLGGLSEGEFLIIVRPAVNPAEYTAGQPVTLVGRLTGAEAVSGHAPLLVFDTLYLRSWVTSSLAGGKPDDLPSCRRIIGSDC